MTSTNAARRLSVGAYHAEVEAALARMAAALPDGTSVALDVLDRELRGPTAEQVLDHLPTGRAQLLDDARSELEDPRPRVPSSPRDRLALVRIMLLQQVDVLWWRDVEPYADQGALDRATDLVSLLELRRAGRLRFSFDVAPSGLLGRGRNRVLRSVAARRRPHVTGLSSPVTRLEVVAVLDEVADSFARAAPSGTPRLWVNSTVRSVERQRQLKDLGYPALLPSSHCLGYAADVEMTWYERFGASGALRRVLLDYRDRDVLNVIDEGQAWHLCLSPEHVARYSPATVG